MTKRGLMLSLRVGLVLLLLATALGMVGCGTTEPTSTPQPTSTPRPTPLPTASPTPEPLDLVVLHTNDVLSYTEPCG
jgi:hypothetical protein